MKKYKKLILIGIVTIFYTLIALNYHKIRFAVSMLRLYKQQNKTETVIDSDNKDNLILENPLDIILKSEDEIVETTHDISEVKDRSETNESIYTETSKEFIQGDKEEKIVIEDNHKSYEYIIKQYNLELESLKTRFESDLDNLIESGIKEYNSRAMSNSKLFAKYLNIGSRLEKSSDDTFNGLLTQMEKDLKNNKHDSYIVKEIKDYYTSFKNSKKTDLINRGLKHLK